MKSETPRTWPVNVNGKDCEVYERYPSAYEILLCDPEFRDDGTEDWDVFVICPSGYKEQVGWEHFDMESEFVMRFETRLNTP